LSVANNCTLMPSEVSIRLEPTAADNTPAVKDEARPPGNVGDARPYRTGGGDGVDARVADDAHRVADTVVGRCNVGPSARRIEQWNCVRHSYGAEYSCPNELLPGHPTRRRDDLSSDGIHDVLIDEARSERIRRLGEAHAADDFLR